MNHQDINAMMAELPSQQSRETTTQKAWIALWFVVFITLCAYAPDIINQPKESTHGNCQENSR
jgi:uncharacterized membrane protein (DUF485 family)